MAAPFYESEAQRLGREGAEARALELKAAIAEMARSADGRMVLEWIVSATGYGGQIGNDPGAVMLHNFGARLARAVAEADQMAALAIMAGAAGIDATIIKRS